MVNWFGRRRTQPPAPKLRPRSVADTPSTKVDLATLTPDLTTFLGKSAYLQLAVFENLSRVVRAAPSTEAKSALSQVAGLALAKHQGLIAEIERHGADAAATMQPFVAEIDRFQRVTEGNDWFESVTSCYLTAGFPLFLSATINNFTYSPFAPGVAYTATSILGNTATFTVSSLLSATFWPGLAFTCRKAN